MKGQYLAWRVIEKRYGAGLDAQKNTFSFPDDVWNELKLKYKQVIHFKDKGLEDKELLQSLFEGRFSTGDDRFTPGSEPTKATQEQGDANDVVDDAFNNQGLDQILDSYFTKYPFDAYPVNQGGPHSDIGPSSTVGSSKLSRKHRKREVEEDPILQIIGELMGYIKCHTLGDEQNTDEAMAQLDELRELGHVTPEEVENALVVFSLRPNQMRIFNKRKDMERKISFLKK